jgi:acyl-CoA synthetase (AMP-forming)/AMP-acid ligase II
VRLEDYLTRNAANMPHRTALVDARRQIDYLALLGECRALAAGLQRRGLAPGDRVAVIAPNRVELITAAFACFLGGFIYQPINFRLSAEEVTNVLDDAQPSALIVDASAFPEHAELGGRRTDLRVLITVGDDAAGYDWSDGERGLPDPDAYAAPLAPPTAAALLYTGGTTGTPKGTVLSHRAWVSSSRDGAIAVRLGRRDVSYMCIPLFHVSFVHFLSTFYLGVPTILRERVRAADFVDAVVNHGVTHTALVQAALVDVLNLLAEEPRELPQMTNLQYGGSPIAPAVIEQICGIFGDVLHQNYGSTEAGGAVTYLPPEDHNRQLAGDKWRDRVSSAGYAMPGQEMAIVDADGRPVPTGEPGDLRVRSASIMDGYWGNEAATREALLPGGWLATGDIARIDEDGYLYVIDRKKDMIISGGENIYARDVEDTLLAHPDIREAAVVGGPHPRLGEEVVAYVVLRQSSELTETDLLAWTTERLARYKKPARILFEDSLPRTPVGKIHKPSLRSRLTTGVTGGDQA